MNHKRYTNTQVLKNEPYKDVPLLNGKFTEGQYTHKIYHLASKVHMPPPLVSFPN